MEKSTIKITTVRISLEQWEKLLIQAKKFCSSPSAVIRMAIENFLKEQK